MRCSALVLVALAVGALVGSVVCWNVAYGAKKAEFLNRPGLLAIAPGMTGGQVVGLIGYPLRVHPDGSRKMAPLGSDSSWPNSYTWIYAEPGFFLVPGLEVSVIVVHDTVTMTNVEYDDSVVYSTVKPISYWDMARLAKVLP